MCFLQQAYKERGEGDMHGSFFVGRQPLMLVLGCISGLPIPAQFCLEHFLCGFLNLPTREENDNYYEKVQKRKFTPATPVRMKRKRLKNIVIG